MNAALGGWSPQNRAARGNCQNDGIVSAPSRGGSQLRNFGPDSRRTLIAKTGDDQWKKVCHSWRKWISRNTRGSGVHASRLPSRKHAAAKNGVDAREAGSLAAFLEESQTRHPRQLRSSWRAALLTNAEHSLDIYEDNLMIGFSRGGAPRCGRALTSL